MKPGDIFHRMTAKQRVRSVAARKHHFQEVYQSPDELIADLSVIIAELDMEELNLAKAKEHCRKLVKTKDEVLNDFAAAFKKFDNTYRMHEAP